MTNAPEQSTAAAPVGPPIRYTGRFIQTHRDDALTAPPAEAMLVADGTIVAIGDASSVPSPSNATHQALDGWVIPGLIEPHGHPSDAALLTSELVVDVRPVVVPTADEVMRRIREALTARPVWVLVNGWDPLLQPGLTAPTIAELDALADTTPLVIVHNSGHSAYFNRAAARAAGVTRDTPDPAGASFSRDASGELAGTALEVGAIDLILAPILQQVQPEIPRIFSQHLQQLRRLGLTTVADLTWNHALDPVVRSLEADGSLPLRLRTYERSYPGGSPSVPRSNGDAWLRQVGVKTWSDGSPWVGNIATSFPYLDTPATRAMGLAPGHHGSANYTAQELIDIGSRYASEGWQLACHAHGDLAIEQTLDAYETIIDRFGLTDHRFRLEHVGAMTPTQFERARALGVTVSVFVDHLTYWGDALVEGLFGEVHGSAWADAGSAFAAGHRATFHNDGWVTPNEPLRNMAVAETRTSRTGRHLAGGLPVTRHDALRAHTENAAWQLFSEHEIGALRPGLFADFTVLDVDPRRCDPEVLATAPVLGSAVAGEYLAN